MTLRETILAKAKAKTVLVTPEWLGQPVELRGLTLAQRRDIVAAGNTNGQTDEATIQVALIIATACDPQTHRLIFEPTDAATLLELPAQAMDELTKPAMEVNGLKVEKAIEDAAKN